MCAFAAVICGTSNAREVIMLLVFVVKSPVRVTTVFN
jgi:hypothetical protein